MTHAAANCRQPLQVMYVHGMGRSPLSGRRMLRRLASAGMSTSSLGYWVSFESFEPIRNRLAERIADLARQGDYVLIGHSLGGVLLRSALAHAMPGRPPARLFLLGSPFRPSRIATRLANNRVYRLLTGDCGQLLASAARMNAITVPAIQSTVVAGTRPLRFTCRLFSSSPNDGVVAVDEVTCRQIADTVEIDEHHTWLPSNERVTEIILARCRCDTQAQTRRPMELEGGQ